MNEADTRSNHEGVQTRDHWARQLGQTIGWSVWLTAALSILLVAGLAAMFGLSLESARWYLLSAMLACAVLHAASRIRSVRLKSEFPNVADAQNGSQLSLANWKSKIAGVCVILVLAKLLGIAGDVFLDSEERTLREFQQSGDRAVQAYKSFMAERGDDSVLNEHVILQYLRPEIASANSQYWKTAVVPLYAAKFTPHDESMPVFGSEQAYQEQWTRIANRVKAVPTARVDQDMLDLVNRHIEYGDSIIRWMSEYRKQYLKQSDLDLGLTLGDFQGVMNALLEDAEEGLRWRQFDGQSNCLSFWLR
jgi:hypothetical protein